MDSRFVEVSIRPVQNRDELEAALRLVHDSYVQRGYMAPQPNRLRLSPHLALPTAQTFVALLHGEVVATLTVFGDSQMLLPADGLFGDEMAELRAQGGTPVEVGMLADRRKAIRRSTVALLEMMKVVFWTALDRSIDDIVIAVHPRHVAFYQRLLCFEPWSDVRDYPAVANAPAVLLRVNFPTLRPEKAENPQIRQMFLTPPEQFPYVCRAYRITPEDLEYFFVRKTNALRELTPAQRRAIEQCYPGLRIAELLGPRLRHSA